MKIVVFAPEAGVSSYYLSHMLTAYGLSLREHEVIIVSCFGALPRCPVLDMYNVSASDAGRKRVCQSCRHSSQEGLKQFRQQSIPLDLYIDQAVLKRSLQELDALGTDLRPFQFDGLDLGELALHDVSLATKQYDVAQFGVGDLLRWKEFILAGVAAYSGMTRLLSEDSYDLVIHFNHYIYQMGAIHAARKAGVKHLAICQPPHRGADYRRLTMVAGSTSRRIHRDQRHAWNGVRNIPVSAAIISEVTLDLLTRIGSGGSHIYSPKRHESPEELRTRLGINPHSQVIVAYTSSPDERQGDRYIASSLGEFNVDSAIDVFDDQIVWLRQLSDWIVEQNQTRSDPLHLIIRIHPRVGAERRNNAVSSHLAELKSHLRNLPKYVSVIWPEDKTSSYDLGELAAVALISWSSIGVELSRLGVPTLRTMAQGISLYPESGIYDYKKTPRNYWSRLSDLLNSNAKLTDFTEAFRWYNCLYLAPALLLDEVSPSPSFQGFPEPRDSVQYDALERVIVGSETPSDINYTALRENQNESSAYVEIAAMCANLGRLFIFLATNRDPGRAVFLSVDGKQCIVGQSEGSVELLPGRTIRLTFEGEVTERFSPMLSRFVPALIEAYTRLDKRYGRTPNGSRRSSQSAISRSHG